MAKSTACSDRALVRKALTEAHGDVDGAIEKVGAIQYSTSHPMCESRGFAWLLRRVVECTIGTRELDSRGVGWCARRWQRHMVMAIETVCSTMNVCVHEFMVRGGCVPVCTLE